MMNATNEPQQIARVKLSDKSNMTISGKQYKTSQLEPANTDLEKHSESSTTAKQIQPKQHQLQKQPSQQPKQQASNRLEGKSTIDKKHQADTKMIENLNDNNSNDDSIKNNPINQQPNKRRSSSMGSHSHEPYIDGWLYKWTNYIKLYQKRWFVLDQGSLSYYRNPNETNLTCRGNISLAGASIHAEESNNLIISNAHQVYHLRATNEIERQRWIMMLELAKTKLSSPVASNNINRINNNANQHLLSASFDNANDCIHKSEQLKAIGLPGASSNIYKSSPRAKIIELKNIASINSTSTSSNATSSLDNNDDPNRQQQQNSPSTKTSLAKVVDDDGEQNEDDQGEEEDDELAAGRYMLESSTKDLSEKYVQLKQQALIFNECTSRFAESLIQFYKSNASQSHELTSSKPNNGSYQASGIVATRKNSLEVEQEQKLLSNILKEVTKVQNSLESIIERGRGFVRSAEEHQQKCRKSIVREKNNRAKLEDLVEQLARQQSEYDEEFYDAEEGGIQEDLISGGGVTSTGDNILTYVNRPGCASRINHQLLSSSSLSHHAVPTTNRMAKSSLIDSVTPPHSKVKNSILADLSDVNAVVAMKSSDSVSETTTANQKSDSSNDRHDDNSGNSDSLHLGRQPRRIPIEAANDHHKQAGGPSNDLEHNHNRYNNYLDNNIEEDGEKHYSLEATTNTSNHNIDNQYQISNSRNNNIDGAIMTTWKRRTVIPHRLNQSLNLWNIMKNCIGKELTKIPIPVNFNEPLSMLQRLTEDYEYAHQLLDVAAQLTDPLEQLVYVAVFAVTSYSTTSNRTGKPFNPLLGETYECDRRSDLGWRCINEQVGHHPPMMASYCEGSGWVSWREFAMTSKFRGKYLQVTPQDCNVVEIGENDYVWRKVDTCVHNIIVGRLWVDHDGEMVITNHTTGDKCKLKFTPYSYFSRDTPKKVSGFAMDKNDRPHWLLDGTWDHEMRAAKVTKISISRNGSQSIETSESKVLWKRRYPAPIYEKMYNMTEFAVQLNEPEDSIAPTDSRNRPDQRLMEIGRWDESNRVKCLLEEKQRATRRNRESQIIETSLSNQSNISGNNISNSRQNPTQSEKSATLESRSREEQQQSDSSSSNNTNDDISPPQNLTNLASDSSNSNSKNKNDNCNDSNDNNDSSSNINSNSNSPLDGPYWFRKEYDPITKRTLHRYTHEYWQCKEREDWSRCPDIFIKVDI